MDPAEEIVGLWLQQRDFFIRHGVKAYRGKEIDFLAVDIKNNRRIHAEVHASVFPVGPLRPWSPVEYGKMPFTQRVKDYYHDKFVGSIKVGTGELLNRSVEDTIVKIFRTKDYEKWLVLGVTHQKDSETQLKQEFKKYGVKVFFLKDILEQIHFKGTAKDNIGRFIQLLAAQLTDKAKSNLLRRK